MLPHQVCRCRAACLRSASVNALSTTNGEAEGTLASTLCTTRLPSRQGVDAGKCIVGVALEDAAVEARPPLSLRIAPGDPPLFWFLWRLFDCWAADADLLEDA